ncbi:hypothetical protein BgiMline_011995 [Biomphalaria glabrata]|uniref:Uncharacterized protein LOC106058052 n=1 Tax=Biomphalaria glabrata TaxID=6526 RepID=A0A9U8E327_BIOGL|nr:uncharacterized protein LOC106058052 [Biomphalaria glabrata]KAI8730969.1 hypothetical protein BgiMline_030594 [Biomphalaria glabrata]
MEKKSLPICLIIYLLCTSRHFASGATSYSVDLSGPGCDNNEGYALKDMNDEAVVFALPQYNAVATRDHCDVKLTTDEGRRIQFLIDMIKFNECGIEIFIFDTLIDANPIYYLRCSDNSKPPIFGKSKFNYLRIRVRKATPESRVYEFRLKAKNDLGPTLQFEQASETFYQEPLEPGAIAGIGVAAAIIIIALILVAIYLCIRGRSSNQEKYGTSNTHGESSVYTTATNEVFFAPGSQRNPKGKYGSMEDIRSSSSTQNKENGAYTNNAYTPGPGEKRSGRSASVGRSGGKNGFANEAFDQDDQGRKNTSYENETSSVRGSLRKSRKDVYDTGPTKQLKSAMKKPSESEMNKVNTQPNGILKARTHSPNRSQTSSNEGSGDTNIMIHGYSHLGKEHPNVKHKPVIERRRSRSGTRSHRSGSSGHGSVRGKRSRSEDKKPPKGGRMYDDVFIDDRKHRSRSSGRRSQSAGTRSQRSDFTDRTSDSLDSESSTTSYSRKVSMNPGGKRVHIKGEETDI